MCPRVFSSSVVSESTDKTGAFLSSRLVLAPPDGPNLGLMTPPNTRLLGAGTTQRSRVHRDPNLSVKVEYLFLVWVDTFLRNPSQLHWGSGDLISLCVG